MAGEGRGGYRQPSKPAAVSGPGALSARTDGGPGAQPVRAAPGQPYGQRQQLEAGQVVQPLPAQQAGLGGAGGRSPGQPPSPAAGSSMGGIFTDPTGMPGEPVTAGAGIGPGPGPSSYFQDDPDELLQVIYEQTGDDELRSLLEGRTFQG